MFLTGFFTKRSTPDPFSTDNKKRRTSQSLSFLSTVYFITVKLSIQLLCSGFADFYMSICLLEDIITVSYSLTHNTLELL